MKITLTKLFALTLFALTLFAQSAPAATPAEDEQAIAKLREGLVDSFNRGDVDQLLTFLDTNAVVTWQNGEVCEGTAEVKAYYERMMKGEHPVVSKVTAAPEILGRHVQGDWAVSWGNLNDYFVLTDGRDLPLNSRFTATIARREGGWKVTAFHISVNAFDNPILKVAVKKVGAMFALGGALLGVPIGICVMIVLRRVAK